MQGDFNRLRKGLEVKPPTDFHCKVCGAVLSAVTLTCVWGEYCKPSQERR